jgi:hypothetical protein
MPVRIFCFFPSFPDLDSPSIGAAILSHHVDTFTLVAAFLLFSIGCLNTLVGLIFRESSKSKRSITSWREHAKSALPTHVAGVDIRPVVSHATPTFVSNMWKDNDEKGRASEAGSGKSGFGFGRQGEKAAGLKGTFSSRGPVSVGTKNECIPRIFDLETYRIPAAIRP